MDRDGTAGYRDCINIPDGYVCTPVCQLWPGYQGRPRIIEIGNNRAIRVCDPSYGTVPLQGMEMPATTWECAPATSNN